MNWFSKIRNTTGNTVSGTLAGPTYSRTANRPNQGQLHTHSPLPTPDSLGARVDNMHLSGIRVDKAREYIAQCERPVEHHPGPLNARTEGRTKNFLRSAAHVGSRTLGTGRGPAPQMEPVWTRPDAPVPIKVSAGPSKMHRALFGLSKGQAAAIKAVEQRVSEKATQLVADSKIGLRGATEREDAVLKKAAHVNTVRETMLAGVQHERGQEQALGAAFQASVQRYAEAKELERDTGQRYTALSARCSLIQQEIRDAKTALDANKAQREAMRKTLRELPPTPDRTGLDLALASQNQAAVLLTRAQAAMTPAQEALRVAQENLTAAKARVRAARPFSSERATAKAEVLACRVVRNECRATVATREVQINEATAHLEGARVRSIRAAKGFGQNPAGGLEPQDLRIAEQRVRITAALGRLNGEGRQLLERGRAAAAELRTEQPQLLEAKAAYETAKEGKVAARIERDNARRAAAQCGQRLLQLETDVRRLNPVLNDLVEPTTKARAEAGVRRDAEALRYQQKISDLVTLPPGFRADQITPELQTQMRAVFDRLELVPPGVADDKAADMRRDRLPTDQTLEIISRSVALATGGNGAEAVEVLTDLMNRQYADLVPQPGMDFNGDPLIVGNVQSDNSAVKRTAGLLAERPSGGEMLKRLVQPTAEPPRPVQDAVLVYFKATNAMTPQQTPDVGSMNWLQYAEQAAKRVAHPEDGKEPVTAMAELSRIQRVAFNGVRNGYTSVAPGSAYEKANQAVQKFSDQWVPRATENSRLKSPLHARHLATLVAADVGAPTLENNLNKQLAKACDELLKVTSRELVEARTRVAHARRNPDAVVGDPPKVPDALLEANNVLHYIKKRADRGDRVDLLTLDKKAWRSIDKKTSQHIKNETTVDSRPPSKNLAEAVNLVGTKRPAAGGILPGAEVLGPQPEFDGLILGLLEMRVDKPTALQAMQLLHERLSAVEVTGGAPGGNIVLTAEEQRVLDEMLAELDDEPEQGADDRSRSSSGGASRGGNAGASGSGRSVASGGSGSSGDASFHSAQSQLSDNARIDDLAWRLDQLRSGAPDLQDLADVQEADLLRRFEALKASIGDTAPAVQPAVDPMDDLERRLRALQGNDAAPAARPADPLNDLQNDLERRLRALQGTNAAPAARPADPLNDLERRLRALGGAVDVPPVVPPTNLDADLARRLQALRPPAAGPVGAVPGDTALLNQQARHDWVQPGAGPLPTIPEDDADVDAMVQAGAQDLNAQMANAQALLDEIAADEAARAPVVPPTELERSLTEAETLTQRINRFRSSEGDFSAEALQQWMIPAITDAFSAVAVSDGTQAGVSANGLVGVVASLSGTLGLVVRPELEANVSRMDNVRFGRTATGIELSLGRTHGASGSMGISASLLPEVNNEPLVLAGPAVAVSHTWGTTRGKDGAVIRAPRFDGKSHRDLTTDFSEMVSTALTWRESKGTDGQQLYEKPLEALLDRHPTISISTVDSAKVMSHTARTNVMGLAAVRPMAGDAAGVVITQVGVSNSATQERYDYKSNVGAHGFVMNSQLNSHTLATGAGAFGRGATAPSADNMAPTHISMAALSANASVRKSSALAGATIIRRPDGSIGADRFVEYNKFDKFEAAVNQHREKWVDYAMRTHTWPEDFPESDKRIIVERTLDDFMVNAKASLQAGTVTLQENMDVKPEVCSQLNANLALEELARLEGRTEDALALQVAREKILADDSSYQPFLLKAIARSSVSEGKGLNLLVSAMNNKGASASQVYDWFPRPVAAGGPSFDRKP